MKDPKKKNKIETTTMTGHLSWWM